MCWALGKQVQEPHFSGSFECRDIVLFRGAYIWSKFGQASCPASHRKRKSCEKLDNASQSGDDSHIPEGAHEGVYRRAMKDKWGTVTRYMYEPRFKPPRERLETCTTLKLNHLPLGGYNTIEEAKIVRQIAAFFYGKGEGCLQLEDGHCFSIPSVSEQEKCPPSGKEKAEWVAREAKVVYALLLKEKARRKGVQPENPALEAGSHDGHDRDVTCRDFPPSTEIDASSSPGTCSTAVAVTCSTSSYKGNGVEQRTASESSWSPIESIPDAELLSDLFSSHDLEPVHVSWKESDVSATEDHLQVAGDDFKSPCVFPLLPQSSAFHIPTTALVTNFPRFDGGAQGLELMEPLLSPATMTTLHQMESVPGQTQLQQLVTCQKRHLTEFAGWNVKLQEMLCESEEQKLDLQQELSQSEAHSISLQLENERLKTMLQQVAKLISTCNLVGNGS